MSDPGETRDTSECCHCWQSYADSRRMWAVCVKCGHEDHVITHAERMARTLSYVFRDSTGSDGPK